MESTHLHERIARATAKLAQLQARELLARQRIEAREREATRRREAQRRARLGQLVITIGGDDLEEGEVVVALLTYRQNYGDAEARQQAKARGEMHLAALAAGDVPRKH